MDTFKTLSKYVHILYYITALVVFVDFILMMIAPNFHIGIAGTAAVLGSILGLISIFLAIKEKSFLNLIIDIIIPVGLFLIFLFGPGI